MRHQNDHDLSRQGSRRKGPSRQEVAEAVAARLYAAEVAIDAALIEVAGLAALLPDARGQALLSATTGQQAFDGASASLSALTAARARLVETHRALSVVARRLGLDILAVGPLDKPEDRPPVGNALRETAGVEALA